MKTFSIIVLLFFFFNTYGQLLAGRITYPDGKSTIGDNTKEINITLKESPIELSKINIIAFVDRNSDAGLTEQQKIQQFYYLNTYLTILNIQYKL